MKLQLVGGGRMGEALLTGLLAAGWATPEELGVVEKLADRRTDLAKQFPGVAILDEPERTDGAVVAVKPDDVERVRGDRRGGVRSRAVDRGGRDAGPAREGARRRRSGRAGDAEHARARRRGRGRDRTRFSRDDDDLAWAESILSAVGVVVRVPEKLLDAVTGLSGSGPAYVFLVAEALIEAGVLAGLPRDVSTTLANQTLLGAARLLTETGDSPEALRAMVTSPGGTTVAGIRALEEAGIRATFLDAVMAATTRSEELGRGG